MDVVGTISYIGQQVNFVDQERFAFLTGNGIAIYDTVKGPRDIVWNFASDDKAEFVGIKTFGVNWERQLMAVARKGGLLEILSLSPADSGSIVSSVFCQMSSSAISTDEKVAVDIEHVSFSRDGTRIFVLTGMMNHQLLIWTVPDNSGGTPELILSYKLSSSFNVCVPNPCNADYFYLQSTTEKSIAIGFVNEILKSYSVKMSSVAIDILLSNDETKPEVSTVTDVDFALWLPGFSLLLGTSAGFISLANCEKGILEYTNLGKFSSREKGVVKEVIPSSAVMSINHVIVATAEGFVYWFPISNNITTVNGEKKKSLAIDLQKPQQIYSTKMQERDAVISTLVVNSDYSTILVGNYSGEIFKMTVEILEVLQLEDSDRVNDTTNKVDILSPVKLVSETKRGVVLCNTNFLMYVKKLSVRSMSTLSLFLTATHTGHICFWRYEQTNIEPMVIDGGVRRSTPRALTLAHGIHTHTKSGITSAITSLSVVPIDFKANANLICAGFDNGKLLIWYIEANECEEDDAKDNEFGAPMEDDEGSCLVKLIIKKVYEFQLFATPVTLLTPIITTGKENSHVRMAIGSLVRPEIILFEMMKDGEFILKPLPNIMFLESDEVPEALGLVTDSLYVWCRSGAVFTFSVHSADVNYYREKLVGVKLPMIYSAEYCPALSEKVRSFVLLTGTKVMYLCSMELASKRAVGSGGDVRATYQEYPHSDIVLKVAYSPNGSLVATACLDGSLYIWKVDEENLSLFLLNRVHLHSRPVTSMSFSYCSSLIMTNSTDGSCFILALEKAKSIAQKASAFLSKGIDYDTEFSSEYETLSAEHPGLTWLDINAKEKQKDIQSAQKFKVMSINSAMSEIGNRLKKLLDQNEMRTDLEQLSTQA
jgi:WD40 repeat protein